MGPTMAHISVKLLSVINLCIQYSMSLFWDVKSSTAETSSGNPVKQAFQYPAVLLCLTSGYFQAIRCCFSCFRCSARWKINSSGYSTSTQAYLNIDPSSLFLPLSLLHSHDDISGTLSPSKIHHASISPSVNHLYSNHIKCACIAVALSCLLL